MSKLNGRKVLVKQVETRAPNGSPMTYTFKSALFHVWGAEFEEFETGPGNCTVAIVEYADGHVDMVHPSFIQFVNADDQSVNCV